MVVPFTQQARCRAPYQGAGTCSDIGASGKTRATAHGLMAFELDVQIALIENHQVFKKLGFEVTEEGVHAGFNRATYFTMRQNIS